MNIGPSPLVSPGLGGFAAFFFLALALWLLMRNMNARMRRMSLKAEARQKELESRMRGEDSASGEGRANAQAAGGAPGRSEEASADRPRDHGQRPMAGSDDHTAPDAPGDGPVDRGGHVPGTPGEVWPPPRG